MDNKISRRTSTTFMIHAIVSVVFGAALWVIPGRTLTLLGWVDEMVPLPESDLSVPGVTFVDAFLTRLLGAALLALALASYQGWRASQWSQVKFIVQLETVFCALGAVAFFASLFLAERAMPIIGWVVMVLLVAFGVAWGVALQKGE